MRRKNEINTIKKQQQKSMLIKTIRTKLYSPQCDVFRRRLSFQYISLSFYSEFFTLNTSVEPRVVVVAFLLQTAEIFMYGVSFFAHLKLDN